MHYDICVIGAGPAGATIANRLVDLGYRVALIEKSSFPRPHIGLSLTSGIHHWLQLLQIDKQVAQLPCKKAHTSVVLWSSEEPIVKTFKKDKAGYHIDRGLFDALLVAECEKKKVSIFQPGSIKNLEQLEDCTWKMNVTCSDEQYNITTSFIVDACGRKSILKHSKKSYQPKLLATYAYWKSDTNKDKNSFIEAGNEHWYWGAPLNTDDFILCIFSDPQKIKDSSSVEEFYHHTLSTSTFASPILAGTIKGEITVCDATPYYDNHVIGNSFIKIGDAAYTMDPISSQGVQKAMKSGIQGAIIVNTILKKQNASLAIRYYENLIASEVRKNKQWTSDFYGEQILFPGSEFWTSRKTAKKTDTIETESQISLKKDDILVLNKKGKFLSVPILGAYEIIEMEGFSINNEEEPFVFVDHLHITPILKLLHKQTLVDCLTIVQERTQRKNPLKIIQWLLYQHILLKQASENELL